MDGVEAFGKLMEGNRRYSEGRPLAPRRGSDRRKETAGGQKPFAIVLTCSDSRVVPEILFDQGIGDIFVVRVAGNVVDDLVLGSIEYAATHLSIPLLLVLGHDDCGAVKAAIAEGVPEGHSGSFIDVIRPVIAEDAAGDPVKAVHDNTLNVVRQLEGSTPILKAMVEAGKLSVRGVHYDITSGLVTEIG
ncbi:MAG: carbonic anhydrase [Candidatus Krumholzibacteria bacterium]|nr:carbonic anhydrase [Candidatus Krumholzibacteria bacterium]